MLLAGLKIVEFSQVIAGPFGGVILSDLGAEVVKIEKPDGGDDGRTTGPAYLHGDSMTFLELNRGKKSMALDLKSQDGIAVLNRLLAESDVFIHNQRPDVVRSLGFDGETLLKQFPRLVYCQISAFGHKGPMELAPGYESIVQSYSGLASINGFPDRPPVRVGSSICDLGTGMWAAIGILAALRQRDRTGKGMIVNASLLETALSWSASAINNYVNTGAEPVRQGSAYTNMVPYQTFEASDGSLVVCAGNDRLFAKLAKVLGHPEWAQDPRYAKNRDRLKNRTEVVCLIQEILDRGTVAAWLEKLRDAAVPCAPVQSIPEVVNDQQVEALNILQSFEGEDLTLVGLPLSFDGKRPGFTHIAPRLGADNGTI
ncbi:CoA transferase [Mesorhizobium sp. CAU 1741]|uniref:CaiB/BaiF CoA transferase family protein n=1 Tax=Mesorhizobium sp. CAU 1741 TaxID=3140366 RepID=UPI00325BFDEC